MGSRREEDAVNKKKGSEQPKSEQAVIWPSERAIVAMSKQMMVDHFENRDIDAVMRNVAQDMTWVGPLACQRARSAAEMRRIIEPEYGTPVKMHDDRWGIRAVGGTRVVVGTFNIAIPQNEGPDVVLLESVTFVWALSPAGKPLVVHLHVSSAYDVPARLDRPAAAGEDGVGYVLDSVTTPVAPRTRIRFDVPGGEACFVAEDRILCLDAAGKGCTVVCDGHSFPERQRLVGVVERLPECFVQIHRSCIVNAKRVVAVRRFEVILDNMTTRPIADRRYLEVAEAVEAAAGRSLREL